VERAPPEHGFRLDQQYWLVAVVEEVRSELVTEEPSHAVIASRAFFIALGWVGLRGAVFFASAMRAPMS
jgi:hypothetical protein